MFSVKVDHTFHQPICAKSWQKWWIT